MTLEQEIKDLAHRLWSVHPRDIPEGTTREQFYAQEITKLFATAREENADLRDMMSAWFEIAKRTEEDVTPILLAGLEMYLRTSKRGGMPSKKADLAMDVLEDFCRLYVGKALLPVLRGLAEKYTEKLK